MKLASPTHAVVGTANADDLAGFLAAFGFESARQATMSERAARELYGLEGPLKIRDLVAGGARERGFVRLVETDLPRRELDPYAVRPLAIDLYTRDVDRSIEQARAAGAELGKLVDYEVGPVKLREVETIGPDGLVLVFIEINHRRPSLLDDEPDRVHSELHSLVFVVPSMEESRRFWLEEARLTPLMDTRMEGPFISELMNLPRPNQSADFLVASDEAMQPARFELLAFVDPPASATIAPTEPKLSPGLHAAGFRVESVARAMAALPSARFGSVVEFGNDPFLGAARAVSGLAPGDSCFELWEMT